MTTATATRGSRSTGEAAQHDRSVVVGEVLAALAILACIVSLGVELALGASLAELYEGWFIHNIVVSLPLAGAFLVLVRRRPDNPVTWILGLAGVGGGLTQVLPIAVEDLVARSSPSAIVHGDLSATAAWAEWVSAWSWVPVVLVLPTLLLLRFPDGRLVGRGWRWAERLAIVGLVTVTSGFAIGFLPPLTDPATPLDDLGQDTFAVPAGEAVVGVGFPLLLLAVVLSVASVVVRARRADADTRRQIRWVGSGLAFLGVAATAFLLPEDSEAVFKAASLVAVPLVATSFPVAILKYRLYDIDVVITRAVTFGVMAAFVTGLYVLVVVGVGSLLGTRNDVGLSVIATVAVAVAFEPVRRWTHDAAARLVYGERATPYETMRRLSSREAHDADDDVARLARAVSSGTGADRVVVWLQVDDVLLPAAVEGPGLADERPRRLDDLTHDLVVPVTGDEGVLGALAIDKPRTEPLTEADRALVADVAAAAVPLVTNVRLRAELARRAGELVRSRRRLVAAQDRARQRLERDLHDGAQQQVVAVKVKLGLARTLASRGGHDDVAAALAELADDVQDAVEDLRMVAHGIYPPLLATEGLEAALQAAARRLAVAATTVTLDDRPPEEIEAAVYFCALEAVVRMQERGAAAIELDVRGDADDVVRVSATTPTAIDAPDLTLVHDRVGAYDGHVDVVVSTEGCRVDLALPPTPVQPVVARPATVPA